METQSIRLRLVFEDRSVLSERQRSDGMNQSWLLIEPQQHPKISDVCNHLLHIFNLRRSCPNGILLYMEDFVLPPSESTRILRDKEILCVKRKEMAIEGVDAGNLLDFPEVNRKEPVNNGMLLLANEEFDKEIGGYQSESEDAEDEKMEDEPSPIETTSKKRKASKTSRSSKKKKHRAMMDVVEDEVVTEDNNINNNKFCPMKVIKPSKEKKNAETILVNVKSPPKVKRKKKHRVLSGDEGEVRDEICNIDDDKIISKKKIKSNEEANKGDAETSDEKVKSPPRTNRSEHLLDNVQQIEKASTSPDEDKKGPSRSARRKKAKRQWKRELAKVSQKPDIDTHLEPEVSKDHRKGHDHTPIKLVKRNLIEEEKRKCNGNTDTQLVACVVKPGHIRFEPLDEDEEDGRQIEVQDVAFQWNGITSKKKGQKWGLEKYSNSRKDESEKTSKEESSPMLNVDTEVPVVDLNDFEKLPLCTSPKEGDVIAYRLVELSSSWTPELSSYRVGKISHFDSNNIILNPVPEYPIVFDKMDEEGPDNYSLYKEDGSLEINFSGLVDVRSVKQSTSLNAVKVVSISNGVGQSQSQSQTPQGDDKDAGVNLISKDSSAVCEAVGRKKEGNNNNNNNNTWNEVMEALKKKKSELLVEANEEMKKDSEWNRWSYRALRGSALGPTMALLRSNNNI